VLVLKILLNRNLNADYAARCNFFITREGEHCVRKRVIFLSALALLVLTSGFFVIYNAEHFKLKCRLDPNKVSEIRIISGNTGKEYEIKGRTDIEHIVDNLNSITFIKDKSSKSYTGFSFSMAMRDKGGKDSWSCIINSTDTIIYNNYFYKDKTSSIDFDYINNLLATQTPTAQY
jgi:hypothetical protein